MLVKNHMKITLVTITLVKSPETLLLFYKESYISEWTACFWLLKTRVNEIFGIYLDFSTLIHASKIRVIKGLALFSFSGDQMYIQQLWSFRNCWKQGRSLCSGYQYHKWKNLHFSLVLVFDPLRLDWSSSVYSDLVHGPCEFQVCNFRYFFLKFNDIFFWFEL